MNTSAVLQQDSVVAPSAASEVTKKTRGVKRDPNSKIGKARQLLVALPEDQRTRKIALKLFKEKLGIENENVSSVYYYNILKELKSQS
jgi:hypothetical protein